MVGKAKTTSNAVKILHKRYIKGSKKRLERLEREREKLNITQQIYDIRTNTGLSQKELAEQNGTNPVRHQPC